MTGLPSIGLSESDFPLRFRLVDVAPTALFVLVVGGLLLAGAPAHAPSADRALAQTRAVGWIGASVATIAVAVIALILQPLELATVRFLEGYWSGAGPLVRVARLQVWVQERRRDRYQWLVETQAVSELSPEASHRVLEWPDSGVLPTALGNRLRAYESTAGRAYGLDAIATWRRLYFVLPESALTIVNQHRNQMDTTCRFSVSLALSAIASFGLLLAHGVWLFFPTALALGSWAAYRAALAAATNYGMAFTAAIDVYHLELLRQLGVKAPQDTADERKTTAPLQLLWIGDKEASVQYAGDDGD